MPKVKLDSAFCLTAHCPAHRKKVDFYDTVITGFLLEVRPNGGKTYHLRYQDEHGRQRQMKIAAWDAVSFADAKKKADRLRSQVALGGNPAAAKAEKKAVATYAELAQKHLDYAKTYQRVFTNTESCMRLHVLPHWGKKYVSEITQPDVANWLADKADEGFAPATVEKMRVTLNRSFELALRWNMPGVVKNPVKGIPRKPINNARERFLSSAEAKRLREAVEASYNPQLKHIVGLLLLTGARVSELLRAEWRHIDIDRRQWLILTSKTGKARRVPLSQAALDILKVVPRFSNCPYVLPNPETKLPYVSIKHSWQTARKAAKLKDLRIHDLRHSAASFMINAGVDLFAVGRVLGHADHKSSMRYSHLANDTLLAAVEAGAMKMNGGMPASIDSVNAGEARHGV